MISPGGCKVIIISVDKLYVRGRVSSNQVVNLVIIHKVKEASCIGNMAREIDIKSPKMKSIKTHRDQQEKQHRLRSPIISLQLNI